MLIFLIDLVYWPAKVIAGRGTKRDFHAFFPDKFTITLYNTEINTFLYKLLF